jgi:hypothetical protein
VTRQRRAGLAALLLFGVLFLPSSAAYLARPAAGRAVPSTRPATSASVATAPAPKSSVAKAPAHLLVIDFLAYAAEAVANDPIPGSPDVEDLIALIGDPTSFGAEVTDQVDADADASSRCGVIEPTIVDALARALNARLSADQRIDPAATTSRSLLHWQAAGGYASLRIFAQDAAGSPSCAEAGTRF